MLTIGYKITTKKIHIVEVETEIEGVSRGSYNPSGIYALMFGSNLMQNKSLTTAVSKDVIEDIVAKIHTHIRMVINSDMNWKLHSFFAIQTQLTKNHLTSYDIILQRKNIGFEKNRPRPILQSEIPPLEKTPYQCDSIGQETVANENDNYPPSKTAKTMRAHTITKLENFGSQSVSCRRLNSKIPMNSIVLISLKSMFINGRVTCSELRSFIRNLKQAGCKIIFFCQVTRKLGNKFFKDLSRQDISPTPRLNPNRIFITSRRTKKQDLVIAHNKITQQFPKLKKTTIVIDEEKNFLESLESSDFGSKKLRCF